MKGFKKLTTLVLAVLMVCTSFAWNGLEVKAADTVYETVDVASGDGTLAGLSANTTTSNVRDTNQSTGASYGKYRLMYSSSYISVPLEEEYTSITIDFAQTAPGNGYIMIGIGGRDTANLVWREAGNKSVKVLLEKSSSDEETWTSKYSTDDGTTWETISYTTDESSKVADGQVSFGDGNLYFARSSDSGSYYINNFTITAEQPAKPVKIGNTPYSSLEAALSEAVDGNTIVLQKDVTATENVLSLTEGVTIDLNGHKLTANYLVAFGNANVIDSTNGSGLLDIQKNLSLSESNSYMPVYDSANAGYKFVNFTMVAGKGTNSEKIAQLTSDYIYMNLEPDFGTTANDLLKANAANTGVRIGVCLSWTTENKTHEQNCWFDDAFVQAAYEDGLLTSGTVNNVMYLIVEGLNAYEDIEATPFVVSKTLGVKKLHSESAKKTIYTAAE